MRGGEVVGLGQCNDTGLRIRRLLFLSYVHLIACVSWAKAPPSPNEEQGRVIILISHRRRSEWCWHRASQLSGGAHRHSHFSSTFYLQPQLHPLCSGINHRKRQGRTSGRNKETDLVRKWKALGATYLRPLPSSSRVNPSFS